MLSENPPVPPFIFFLLDDLSNFAEKACPQTKANTEILKDALPPVPKKPSDLRHPQDLDHFH